MSNNLPWVEKYRPSSLNNILSQPHVTDTLRNFLNNKKLPHMIFYGSLEVRIPIDVRL